MQALLKHKSTRKNFLLVISLVLFLIIAIRVIIVFADHPEEISSSVPLIKYLEDILDKLFTSLLVAVFIGLFLFYIEIPDVLKKHEIIDARHLPEIFQKAQVDSEFWYFSGGAGRFTRAKTIPRLHELSKARNEHRRMKVLLLDPMNDELCNQYANFRQHMKSSSNEWVLSFVRNEIIATICSACIYQQLNPNLDIQIYLKKAFSTLRIDIGNESCIVTKEDGNEPALLIPKDTYLYKTYLEEILQTSKQCTEILIKLKLESITVGKVKHTDIEHICQQLKFSNKLNQNDYKVIADILNKNNNPFGS